MPSSGWLQATPPAGGDGVGNDPLQLRLNRLLAVQRSVRLVFRTVRCFNSHGYLSFRQSITEGLCSGGIGSALVNDVHLTK